MENKILKAIENLDKKLNQKIDNLDKKFEKRFGTLEKRFDTLEKRFDVLEKRFDVLESQTKENTQILKALMHSAEVNKAEHEQIMSTMVRIEGDVTALKKDLLTVETVTANNYVDIVKLKAVK